MSRCSIKQLILKKTGGQREIMFGGISGFAPLIAFLIAGECIFS